MKALARGAAALRSALGRPGSIRSKILTGFALILAGMLSINLCVIALSHHLLGEYHVLTERVISANRLIPIARDDVGQDAYYLVAGRRTLETTQLFNHMSDIQQGLESLMMEDNSEDGREQLKIALRTFGTLQRYCDQLEQEIIWGLSVASRNDTLEEIRDVSALVYSQLEEYIYQELLRGESIDQTLQRGFQLLLLGDLAAVLLMAAALGILLIRIDRTINDPIQALVENTRRLSEGDFDALVEDAGESEITVLNKSFNRMVAKLQRLMEKIEEDTRTREQLELRLLQEQINPHFLYNTLEIIVWLAESGDKEQVIQVVQSLSRFFRVVLSKGRAVVSLREELSCIESYLYIQKVRYADILNYEIEAEPEALGCRIQKLSLQPIVENALYHGLEKKRGGGTIRVRAWVEEGDLVVRVSDDGSGMTAEQADALRRELRGGLHQVSEGGFGLPNIQKRIQLAYGPEYGIELWSEPGCGTQVTLRIPAGPEKS